MAGDRNRLTRIYTRSGDGGSTRLVGGQEVSKADLRIEAYGTVDELSSVLGIVRALNEARASDAPGREDLDRDLRRVQNELFHIGADLATRVEDRFAGMKEVGEAEIADLEKRMDAMNEVLGPLKDFILPGGGPLGAHLHLGRTVCRRAERCVVALRAADEVPDRVVRYLNRLSDYLFVLARFVARQTGHPESLWER